MLRRRLLALAAAAAAGLAATAATAAVNVINGIGQPVTIQLGYADDQGVVAEWNWYVIKPCFYMLIDEAPNLRMLYPKYLDGRINPDHGGIDYELILLNAATTLTLFNADPLIMVDAMGRTDCGTLDQGAQEVTPDQKQ